MNKRTKLKLQNAKIYLKKNVFNGRYIVRNILCVIAGMMQILVWGWKLVLLPADLIQKRKSIVLCLLQYDYNG